MLVLVCGSVVLGACRTKVREPAPAPKPAPPPAPAPPPPTPPAARKPWPTTPEVPARPADESPPKLIEARPSAATAVTAPAAATKNALPPIDRSPRREPMWQQRKRNF